MVASTGRVGTTLTCEGYSSSLMVSKMVSDTWARRHLLKSNLVWMRSSGGYRIFRKGGARFFDHFCVEYFLHLNFYGSGGENVTAFQAKFGHKELKYGTEIIVHLFIPFCTSNKTTCASISAECASNRSECASNPISHVHLIDGRCISIWRNMHLNSDEPISSNQMMKFACQDVQFTDLQATLYETSITVVSIGSGPPWVNFLPWLKQQ